MNTGADSRYVALHFWTLGELADAVGASAGRVRALVDAGCGPLPSYVLAGDGWWSALDREHRAMPDGAAWYARGAAWTLRRALMMTNGGMTEIAAAAALLEQFAAAFVIALGRVDDAVLAFPDCFDANGVIRAASVAAASQEWEAWIDGGYGNCLRVFTAETCVMKETLAASMKAALASGNGDVATMVMQAETLDGLILPFAPWQRPTGTPGRTIDRLLAAAALGSARAYDRL